jgi:hypothetical protein
MENRKKAIAIISCYGYFDESRSQVELDGLYSYLDLISKDIVIQNQTNNINMIVLSGGYTKIDQNKQFISEAQSYISVFNELTQRNNLDIPIITENISLSHYEKVVFSILALRNLEFDHIIVYCDANYAVKVNAQVYGLINDYLTWQVIPIPRQDIHPNNNSDFQSYQRLPEEIFSQNYQNLKQILKVNFDKS